MVCTEEVRGHLASGLTVHLRLKIHQLRIYMEIQRAGDCWTKKQLMQKVVAEKHTTKRFGKTRKVLSVNHASLCCACNSMSRKCSWQSENKLFYGAV